MRAIAPASSANLGPGFDTLALAVGLYVDVEVVPADTLTVQTFGEGADLPQDATHLAAVVATRVAGHDRLRVTVRSEIPVGRGLGSSAALAAAAAAAAGADDPLAVAAEVDGHPENAAASVLGGLVTATTLASGEHVVSPLPLDTALAFVVLVPDRTLPTKEARAALPAQVPHPDAAFNLGRMGLLLTGLADAARLRPEATEDRLHQNQRAPLFPEAAGLMAALVDAGALASCWSGAGPTLLAFVPAEQAEVVRAAGEQAMAQAGVAGRSLVLEADRHGLTITDAG